MTERQAITVESLPPGELGQAIDFFRSIEPVSTEYLNWLYRDNPVGPAVISCAVDQGRIVGMLTNFPMPFTYRGERFTATQSVNALTHPDYRGRGLFKLVTQHVCDNALASGHRLSLAFPNEYSLPGFVKLGHVVIGTPTRYVLVLRPGPLLSHRLGRKLPGAPLVDAVTSFVQGRRRRKATLAVERSDLSRLCAPRGMDAGDFFALVKDTGWLRWRYSSLPGRTYDILHVGDESDPLGVIVLSRIEERISTGATIPMTVIVDLLLASGTDMESAAGSLITAATSAALADGSVAILACANPATKAAGFYRSNGYIAQGSLPSMIVYPYDRDGVPKTVAEVDVSYGMMDGI